jgi:hypothetical protein
MAKKNFINEVHLEGFLYEHDLKLRVTGANSKKPGTEFISGSISIATDNDRVNIVPVYYTYVTEITSSGKQNATFAVLKKIFDGEYGTQMKDGIDKAVKLRVDTALGLNDFYTDKNGTEELVSTKRNEGGFIHVIDDFNPDESKRNTFTTDVLITGVTRMDEDEEHNLPERVTIKGAIFDFRGALLPYDFIATNPKAMDYFESLEASSSNPIPTKIYGRFISQTTYRTVVEESAFGEPIVQEIQGRPRRSLLIYNAARDTYTWDDESFLTATELKEKISEREVKLATEKQRSAEWKSNRNTTTVTATSGPAKGQFDF